jgi:hypothetical protein
MRKKPKKEPVDNFFSEGVGEMVLGVIESWGPGLQNALVKTKNRRSIMKLAVNLVSMFISSLFSQIYFVKLCGTTS